MEEGDPKLIAAALGDAFDVVLVESAQSVEQALGLLEKASGRAVILSLDGASGNVESHLPQAEAVIGLASKLIKTRDELRPVLEILLKNTLLVKDRGAAVALRAAGHPVENFAEGKGLARHRSSPWRA